MGFKCDGCCTGVAVTGREEEEEEMIAGEAVVMEGPGEG